MVIRYNPSVHQELRYEIPPVVSIKAAESLLSWLKRTGRLKPRDSDLSQESLVLDEIEEIIDVENYPVEEEE